MVIDVFVHPDAPLVGRQVAKENMRMRCTFRRPTRGKAFHQPREPLTLGPQVLRVFPPQACVEFGPQLRDPLSYTRGSMDTGPLGECGAMLR